MSCSALCVVRQLLTKTYINFDRNILAEVGKVTFKINGDEALSDESVLKSNGD